MAFWAVAQAELFFTFGAFECGGHYYAVALESFLALRTLALAWR